jgi:AAA+ ATPase superfamily predicted ATPase
MMVKNLVGRKQEQAVLQASLTSQEAEMVAVIGRRRVGKTYLIKNTYADHIVFEVTGVQHAEMAEQLQNFAFRINHIFYGNKAKLKPKNWLDAFQMLILALEKQQYTEKVVIFLDELPWFDSRKSGFLRALGFFWNSWCVDQNIVVVICGSAASWMIEQVVNDKGGLHNRITRRVDLQPFTLYETDQYLKSRNVRLDTYQTLQIYMVFGGIPHYLKEILPGKSAIENIGAICFSPASTLANEFQNLYPALFENAANHSAVIRALSQKWKGLSRKEILETAGLPDGGNTSVVLQELLYSGFITQYYPYGKVKRELLYRLTDEYSLFYLNFIENSTWQGNEWWQALSQTAGFKSWCGYAFENICLKHLPQIKKALGISGIYAEASAFAYVGTKDEKGFQIDLVLDRKDQTINLFEFKFYNAAFSLDKSDAAALRERMETFRQVSKTPKHIFLSFLSTFGVKMNENSLGLVDNNLDATVLFEP